MYKKGFKPPHANKWKMAQIIGDQIMELFFGKSISIDANEKYKGKKSEDEVVQVLDIIAESYFVGDSYF